MLLLLDKEWSSLFLVVLLSCSILCLSALLAFVKVLLFIRFAFALLIKLMESLPNEEVESSILLRASLDWMFVGSLSLIVEFCFSRYASVSHAIKS